MSVARIVGFLASLLLIGASMAMNALFLSGQGKTPIESMVFACVSLSGDAYKAVLPVLIAAAWQEGRRGVAVIGTGVFGILAVFAFASALGYAAENRGFLSGTHDYAHAQLVVVREELKRQEEQFASLENARASGIIEQDLAVARSEHLWDRTRQCTDVTVAESRVFCRRYHDLNAELARSAEKARLEHSITELRQQEARLVARGAALESDAQAGFIERLSGIKAALVRDVLIVLIAVVVELGSGFGLLLASRPVPKEAPQNPVPVLEPAPLKAEPLREAEETKPEALGTALAVVEDRAVEVTGVRRRVGQRAGTSKSKSVATSAQVNEI